MIVETLRSQFNHRQGNWRIVKKTNNGAGGWRMFGGSDGYASRQACDARIEKLIGQYPDSYKRG